MLSEKIKTEFDACIDDFARWKCVLKYKEYFKIMLDKVMLNNDDLFVIEETIAVIIGEEPDNNGEMWYGKFDNYIGSDDGLFNTFDTLGFNVEAIW